jgi:hypothetical protein
VQVYVPSPLAEQDAELGLKLPVSTVSVGVGDGLNGIGVAVGKGATGVSVGVGDGLNGVGVAVGKGATGVSVGVGDGLDDVGVAAAKEATGVSVGVCCPLLLLPSPHAHNESISTIHENPMKHNVLTLGCWYCI